MYLENSILCWVVNILIEIKVLSDHRLGCVGVGVRDGVEQFMNYSPWEESHCRIWEGSHAGRV